MQKRDKIIWKTNSQNIDFIKCDLLIFMVFMIDLVLFQLKKPVELLLLFYFISFFSLLCFYWHIQFSILEKDLFRTKWLISRIPIKIKWCSCLCNFN